MWYFCETAQCSAGLCCVGVAASQRPTHKASLCLKSVGLLAMLSTAHNSSADLWALGTLRSAGLQFRIRGTLNPNTNAPCTRHTAMQCSTALQISCQHNGIHYFFYSLRSPSTNKIGSLIVGSTIWLPHGFMTKQDTLLVSGVLVRLFSCSCRH